MARSIVSKPNTVAPDSDYPGGRFKDKVGSNPGTRVNEAMTGDWAQFFDKMMRETGATYNELPDNEYSGQQFFDAMVNVFGGLRRAVIEIGAWNMDADSSKLISTDVAFSKVRSVSFTIIADTGNGLFVNGMNNDDTLGGAVTSGVVALPQNNSGDLQVSLQRETSGYFDANRFDDPTMNRGWIIVEYVL